MTKDEALRLALEALENSVDLVRENAYNAEQLYGNYPARQGKVRGLKVLADDHEKAITAVEAALEAKDEPAPVAKNEGGRITWMIEDWPQNCLLYTHLPKQEAKDEPVAWRDAAIRLGEELSSVGPDGYYDMDAKEWLDWAMEQNPRGKRSLPQRTWIGLADEDRFELAKAQHAWEDLLIAAEAKLKQKNFKE